MFSNACKNAIRAVLYLAIHSGDDCKLTTIDLANALDVSHHFLAKTLQQLTKNGLISSARGPNGGFYLSEENRNLNLLSIIALIDGAGSINECVLGLPKCSSDNPCPFHTHVSKFREGLDHFLLANSIGEAAKRVRDEDLRF
ncbi:MAG: Rrf2 family transcriptional regulator [Saprospiraceae bacterium]|nr:Rrf2 family transcriptional regulator [Saprospiraceae bacterium]